jgi:hypothetical protein
MNNQMYQINITEDSSCRQIQSSQSHRIFLSSNIIVESIVIRLSNKLQSKNTESKNPESKYPESKYL